MVADPYRVLNLPHSATDSQIKRSYRELARRYHPDRLISSAASSSQLSGMTDDSVLQRKQEEATRIFAQISEAYALLNDPRRKAQYDHVYKYGGYDDDVEHQENYDYHQKPIEQQPQRPQKLQQQMPPQRSRSTIRTSGRYDPQRHCTAPQQPSSTTSCAFSHSRSMPAASSDRYAPAPRTPRTTVAASSAPRPRPTTTAHKSSTSAAASRTSNQPQPSSSYQPQQEQCEQQQSSNHPNRKRKSMSVGYSCVDPLAFLWTNGRVQTNMAVAGIQIPSRLSAATGAPMPTPAGGVRFAFSSGQIAKSPSGTRTYTTKTTQFAQGKKYTRTETTILYPDGRKEVVIEGNDFVERRYTTSHPATTSIHEDMQEIPTEPWYAHVLHGIRDKLTMCYNPCAAVAAQ